MLKIQSISKSYNELLAVDNLTLELKEGEIFGFLGPNGAGKTTSISMIAGLLEPDSGTIQLGEFGSPEKSSARMQLGYAPQSLALYEPLSAEENLRFFGQMYQLSGKDLNNAVDDALKLAGLIDRRKDAVSSFSGGMKRRLNLATAMIHKPKLLLLDEPTVGVDPQSRNALLESITQLRDQGHTIIYTTHYMEEAQKICDRIAIMDHGKLLAMGSLQELIHLHGSGYKIKIETPEETKTLHTKNPSETLSKLSFNEGTDLMTVTPPDLEQIFLKLTGRQLRD